MSIPVKTIEKRTGWVRKYNFNFDDFAEIQALETITGTPIVTVIAGGGGLTVGTPVVNSAGTKVQVQVTGGTADVLYVLLCTITTSGGATLSQEGNLEVIEN